VAGDVDSTPSHPPEAVAEASQAAKSASITAWVRQDGSTTAWGQVKFTGGELMVITWVQVAEFPQSSLIVNKRFTMIGQFPLFVSM
jgi:hypothetical protein